MNDVEKLHKLQSRMPTDKQGVEIEIGGKVYKAFIRRLTPTECARLQTIPENYEFVTSESQVYKGLGNGWTIEVIKHCFSNCPYINKKSLKVLSLFDGLSCGQMALRELDANVEVYVASEVDKHAIANTMHNFPDTIQVGDVRNINVAELVEKYGVFDLLCGGSPCQSFSFSGKMKGMSTTQGEEIYSLDRYLHLKEQGFEFEGQSYLFWEYMRILTELRKYNPDIYFFLENVEMLDKWERCLSHAIGVQGVHINSALVSAQQRKRIYWSNFRTKDTGVRSLFDDDSAPFSMPYIATDIPQPTDRGIVIKDIMQEECDAKYYLKDELVQKLLTNTDKRKLAEYVS